MRIGLYINIKNELRMVEFIKYYLKIGIDYFIIFDDDSEKNIKDVLEENNIDNKIYSLLYSNGRNFMRDVYNTNTLWKNEIIPILKDKNIDYVLQVDADEFLFINKFSNIRDLVNYYEPFDSLKINWLIFGSNYILKNNSDSVINCFLRSSKKLSWYVKSLTKVSSIVTDKYHSSHVIAVKDGSILKNSLNKIISKENAGNIQEGEVKHFDYDKVPTYIAHYMLQDPFSYIERKILTPMFLNVSQHYYITNDIIENIKKNKNEFAYFLSKNLILTDENYENNEEINKIYNLTNLPKKILRFLNGHYHFFGGNEIENYDIVNYYNGIIKVYQENDHE